MIKQFKKLPELATGYPLRRYIIEVVLARAALNMAINGSFEKNTYNWSLVSSGFGGSIGQSAEWQRYGSFCLKVNPTAGVNDGACYGDVEPLALAAGRLYFASIWGKFSPGTLYKMYFASTGGTQVGNAVKFKGLGRPQRIIVPYYERAGDDRRVYVTKNNQTSTQPFYLDGFQVEPDRITDYLDGSLLGFVANENAYIWNGEPHASTSRRSASTRSGGEAVPLSKYYFTLMALMGLGIHPVNNVATPLSMTGGSIYQRQIPASERTFDLIGDFRVPDDELDEVIEQLTEAITFANSPTQQPILLRFRVDESSPGKYSDVADVPCLYADGLEGARNNQVGESPDIRFVTYLPVIQRQGHQGTTLGYQDLLDPNRFIRRSPDGSWGSAGGGVTGGFVTGITQLPFGKIVVFGDFTAAGGVSNTRGVALYDPLTDSFSAMGTGGGVGSTVYAAAASPDGREVTIIGVFPSMGGVANTVNIARFNFQSGTWSSIAAGVTGQLNAIAYRPNGNLIVGGGVTVIDAVSVTNIAEYDGASWVAVGNPGGFVGFKALYAKDNTSIYAGLNVTTGALVGWDGAAWSTLIPFALDARAFSMSDDGTLYFLDDDGISSKLWAYNGFAGTKIFEIAGKNGFNTFFDNRTGLLYLSGDWDEINGAASPSGFFYYTGGRSGAFIGLDFVASPASPAPVSVGLDGSLYFGVPDVSNIPVSHTNVVHNSGSTDANPIFRMMGSHGNLWQIRNISTGDLLYFNLVLLEGEPVTLYLLHNSVKFVSDWRGDLLPTILPGSSYGAFHLAPGDNLINVFMTYTPIIRNDQDALIGAVSLQGATRINTENGRIYLTVSTDGGGNYHIDFYRDEALTLKVAGTGVISGTGDKTVNAFGSSGLSGTITMANAPGGPDIDIFIVVPIIDAYWTVNYTALTGIVK